MPEPIPFNSKRWKPLQGEHVNIPGAFDRDYQDNVVDRNGNPFKRGDERVYMTDAELRRQGLMTADGNGNGINGGMNGNVNRGIEDGYKYFKSDDVPEGYGLQPSWTPNEISVDWLDEDGNAIKPTRPIKPSEIEWGEPGMPAVNVYKTPADRNWGESELY